MQEFIHHKVKVIEEFFVEFNQVQRLYGDRSFDFEQRFTVFLNKLSDYFKERGENTRESEVLRVNNMLYTVKKGFDPSKMEKINSGRRELWWGFSYNGIESLETLLQDIYKKEISKLQEGKEILSNLILNLYQQGFLTDNQLRDLDSVTKVEAFWRSLLMQNGSMSVINKKLLTHLITEDIYLLLEEIISEIVPQ